MRSEVGGGPWPQRSCSLSLSDVEGCSEKAPSANWEEKLHQKRSSWTPTLGLRLQSREHECLSDQPVAVTAAQAGKYNIEK